MLHINDVTYRMEGRPLFEQATLAVEKGHKVGLVGRNGSGKSTLFRLIKGQIAPDDGSISLQRGIRMGAVDQEVPSGPQSLLETVLSTDKERAKLLKQAESETDPFRIAEIHTRLGDIDAYSAEARAATILAGLGFRSADQIRPCSDFSGGWRMRVALAGMLFAEPDLLLLDEPTNYLDIEGAIWLENHLRTYRRTVFVISHDRDFLNAAVTHIAHLRQNKLFLYSGNYDAFEIALAEQQRLSHALRAKQEDERRHLESFVERFRAKASKAKQAQSRIKKLEKMRPVATIINDPIPPIDLPSPEKLLAPPILRFEEASLQYDTGPVILRNLNLRLDNDDRIGLLGRNGEGKSTLAKAILRQLTPVDGKCYADRRLKIAYFAQHQIDALSPEKSAYDHVEELMPDATIAERRARLARFGLGMAQAETPAKSLSGGEKARLLFSLISFDAPHLLVLDEPANHLDMDSRAELIKALNSYSGAVLIISHDRGLMEAVTDRLWLVDKGTVEPFEGTLEDYKSFLLAPSDDEDTSKSKAGNTPSAADKRREAAEARAALAPLKKRLSKIEKEIEEKKFEISKFDFALADPELFQNGPELAAKIGTKRRQASDLIEELEVEWLELSETIEAAEAH